MSDKAVCIDSVNIKKMITKRISKLIKSLQLKKYRKKTGLFVVEGKKVVAELLGSGYNIQTLIGTPVFMNLPEVLAKSDRIKEHITTGAKELSAVSHFKTSDSALAIVEMPKHSHYQEAEDQYVIVLDDIKDPGNLGTILRIADWYGIRHIICSPETTDAYSPKAISASMGSFIRVNTYYIALDSFLSKSHLPVYAAVVDQGNDVHHVSFSKGGALLMGNESRGINKNFEKYIDYKISIPAFGHAESLNVSISTGIICDNIARILSKGSKK